MLHRNTADTHWTNSIWSHGHTDFSRTKAIAIVAIFICWHYLIPILRLVQELCCVYSSEMLSVNFAQIAKIKIQTQATRVQGVPLHHRQICKFKKCRQSSAFEKSADNPLSGWSSTPLLPAHCKVQNAECKVHFYQCKVQSAKCRVLLPKYLSLPVLQQCSSEHRCSSAPIVRSLTVQRASAKSLTVQRAQKRLVQRKCTATD